MERSAYMGLCVSVFVCMGEGGQKYLETKFYSVYKVSMLFLTEKKCSRRKILTRIQLRRMAKFKNKPKAVLK